jgi:antitoxin FitA
MANLLIRNVEDDLVAQLKRRAQAHGRSSEAELREIVKRALSDSTGFEELAAQMLALTAGRRHTPAEDILRETRDER